MANLNKKKVQIPKAVLDMKFMRKTKERIDKELQNTHGHSTLYSNIITDEMRHASGNYLTEASFIFCEDLLEGRLSFKGMNPEIERLMDLDKKNNPDETEMQKDISDVVLAEKFQAFKNNRKRPLDSPSKYSVLKKKKYIK